MKTMLLGNEAVARGLYEAGCHFLSYAPCETRAGSDALSAERYARGLARLAALSPSSRALLFCHPFGQILGGRIEVLLTGEALDSFGDEGRVISEGARCCRWLADCQHGVIREVIEDRIQGGEDRRAGELDSRVGASNLEGFNDPGGFPRRNLQCRGARLDPFDGPHSAAGQARKVQVNGLAGGSHAEFTGIAG